MILTEDEYRALSGDTRSPWGTTGASIGVSGLLPIVEQRVTQYIATFLEPTKVTGEEHQIDSQSRYRMGVLKNWKAPVHLDYVRLLTGSSTYLITARFPPLTQNGTSYSSSAVQIMDARLGLIDLAECYCSLPCTTARTDMAFITYWSGYTAAQLPDVVKLSVALLGREIARELIVKRGFVMDDDYPNFAAVKVWQEMGVSRSFNVGMEEGFFGFTPVSKYVETTLSVLRPMRARGFR